MPEIPGLPPFTLYGYGETTQRVDILSYDGQSIVASYPTSIAGSDWYVNIPVDYAGCSALLYRRVDQMEHVRIPVDIGSALDCTEGKEDTND